MSFILELVLEKEKQLPGAYSSSGVQKLARLLVGIGTLLILSLLVKASHMVRWAEVYILHPRAKHHEVA